MNPQDHQNYFNYMKHFQSQHPGPNGGPFYYPFTFPMQFTGYPNVFPMRTFSPYMNPYGPPEPIIQKTPQQQQTIIVISDDEEAPKKTTEKSQTNPIPVPVQPQPRKQTKMLDLDQLESQGRLYDCESSESPQLPRRTIRQIRYEQYQSPKLKKRQIKIRKETTRVQPKSVKQVPIGIERQQLTFPQSSVKTRLIRVYVKNEEKFQRLYDMLKLSCPNCNDEDVARILNIAGKDYERAMSLVQENGLSIQYFIETYQNKDQSDEEPTDKK